VIFKKKITLACPIVPVVTKGAIPPANRDRSRAPEQISHTSTWTEPVSAQDGNAGSSMFHHHNNSDIVTNNLKWMTV
jgi:hypothetical protein